VQEFSERDSVGDQDYRTVIPASLRLCYVPSLTPIPWAVPELPENERRLAWVVLDRDPFRFAADPGNKGLTAGARKHGNVLSLPAGIGDSKGQDYRAARRGDTVSDEIRNQKCDSPKNKFYILRNRNKTGVCWVIQASSEEEAKARVGKLEANFDPAAALRAKAS
jgi:hypothetical protein